ncbi:hypothetical protein CONCODRAFT_18259 [Conidiobolus coronatus NRRL 28638]|uniref:Homeodomain-like protein n=1 Tax=Conidiobolus coronatus (strain ATCC 28846 / CBS 209.66 / NRRL 28638) TaxID=796925 RepID=A0A137P3C9_CONC2|nr:hypothetical protein CONCODRAFT_18259 [Conidiobolus coronatus NRRL 28638]|eukprot:KXN69536.1 hypothetical protein CONCODRAFT_18259 [Conidiobolus coronatus NRRL 28638]
MTSQSTTDNLFEAPASKNQTFIRDNQPSFTAFSQLNLSVAELEACLFENRRLQEALKAKLHQIEQAKLTVDKHRQIVQDALPGSTKRYTSSGVAIPSYIPTSAEIRRRLRSNLQSNSEVPGTEGTQTYSYFPYFVDQYGNTPPDNTDTGRRKMYPPFVFSAKKWYEKENIALAKGVRQQNIKILSDRLMREKKITSQWEVKQLPDRHLEMNLEGIDWDKIAKFYVPGRTGRECAIHWTCWVHPLINREDWTREEEERLVELVKEFKYLHWDQIALKLNTNRTAVQCFCHFQSKLNSTLTKRRWTSAEDTILREAVRVYGERNWQQVAHCLDNRTGQQCLHRWSKTLSPSIKRGRWDATEDAALRSAIEMYGEGNWIKVQQHVPGRTDVQCRERWMNILHPNVNQEPWTDYEDAHLLLLVQKIGLGKWSQICSFLGTRTDNQCWRRWKKLDKTGKTNHSIADLEQLMLTSRKPNFPVMNYPVPTDQATTNPDIFSHHFNSKGKRQRISLKKQAKMNHLQGHSQGVGADGQPKLITTSLGRRLNYHTDFGKPMPPTLQSVNLLSEMISRLAPEDQSVEIAESSLQDRDHQRLQQTFFTLFGWPTLLGGVAVDLPPVLTQMEPHPIGQAYQHHQQMEIDYGGNPRSQATQQVENEIIDPSAHEQAEETIDLSEFQETQRQLEEMID